MFSAYASLENAAKRMGIEVVTCALWSIVRSLTAAHRWKTPCEQ